MIRRALIISNTMNQGGAETFLMKLYRALDKNKYQFDFYIMGGEGYYDEEIKSAGGNIYYGPMKTTNFKKYKQGLKNFFKTHKYETVFKSVAHSLSTLDLYYAKKYGKVKNRIARSAIAEYNAGPKHYLFRPISNTFSNIKIAPSTESGLFMFGKKAIKSHKVDLIINGVDNRNFKFLSETRKLKRTDLKIRKNEILFMHVGRFDKQKNHSGLINIFSSILKKSKNAKLICVGKGPLKGWFVDECKQRNIRDKVIILEDRNDVNELLMAADVFLFPSLFEGLPNVVMEAQAAGLPCLISSTITKECMVTDYVKMIDLGCPDEWAEEAFKLNFEYSKKRGELGLDDRYDIRNILKLYIKNIFN